MKFARIVTVSGLFGLTNAYRSVLSTAGSSAISGASRWLDAVAPDGPALPTKAAAATEAMITPASARSSTPLLMCSPFPGN